MAANYINLYSLNSEAYAALSEYDPKTLYFISDKNCIYVRGKLYGGRFDLVTSFPADPETGVLYINKTSTEAKIWNGANWDVVAKGFTVAMSDSSDDSLLPTAKAVATYVSNKIADVTGGSGVFVTDISASGNGTITINKGENLNNVTLTNMVYSPTWDNSTRTLTLPIAGGTTLSVALGRDLVVKAGKYNSGTKEIWLSIAADGSYTNTEEVIKIPVSSLIDIYTGKNTSTATTTVSATNEISVDIKLSTKEGNALSIDSLNDGLYVSVPDDTTKIDKVTTGHANEILIANADGGATLSDKTIGSAALSSTPNSNTDATEAAVKTYADTVGANAISTAASDATAKSNTAEQNAKAYADEIVKWTNW